MLTWRPRAKRKPCVYCNAIDGGITTDLPHPSAALRGLAAYVIESKPEFSPEIALGSETRYDRGMWVLGTSAQRV
jgi:hypothetical protein